MEWCMIISQAIWLWIVSNQTDDLIKEIEKLKLYNKSNDKVIDLIVEQIDYSNEKRD